MEKTSTLSVRVNPQVKNEAEGVLAQLGIPLSTAVTMYLRQIALTGGIPFPLSLPQAPRGVNADLMTDAELASTVRQGLQQVQDGRGASIAQARAELLP